MNWPISSLYHHVFMLFLVIRLSIEDEFSFRIKIQTDIEDPPYCHGDFLSMAIGLSKRTHAKLDYRNHKLVNLAAALSPANFRLGGSRSNFLTFCPIHCYSSQKRMLATPRYQYQNFTFTGKKWQIIANFTKTVGWDMMYDLNALNMRRADGSWDSKNAELFLDYSQRKGIDIAAFELGNEPNSNFGKHGKAYTAATAAADMHLLKKTLNKFPRYKNSKIVGPEVTSISRHRSAYNYMKSFLEAGGNKAVDAISWHHYYVNGRTAKAKQFLDPKVLDGMKTELQYAHDLLGRFPPDLPMVLTETSSAFGGGAPDLSNRFVSGFMWLDKLGLCAQAGVSAVYRQTLNQGNYGVLHPKSFDPFPDYYLSVLFKRLVLGPVLKASFEPQTDKLRVYAHCCRLDYYSYPEGAIVLYYLNLHNSNVTLRLPEYQGKTLDLYQLTPGDVWGLRSRFVKLNGEKLLMQGDTLPPLSGKRHRGIVTVEPQSFGYIVVIDAKISECLRSGNQRIDMDAAEHMASLYSFRMDKRELRDDSGKQNTLSNSDFYDDLNLIGVK